jgi:fucose permease
MAPIFPTTLTLASHRMPITGKVAGWFLTGASLGATLIPLLIGQLLQTLGPIDLIASTSAVLLMDLGILAFVVKAPTGKIGSEAINL